MMLKNLHPKLKLLCRSKFYLLVSALILIVLTTMLAIFPSFKQANPQICSQIGAQADCIPKTEVPSGNPDPNLTCNPGLNQQCRKVGINFATGPVGDEHIDRADRLNLGNILSIASHYNQIDGIANNFNRSLDQGMSPVLRICVSSAPCDFHNVDTYKNFLIDLSNRVGNRPFYAISGPNEPLTEVWLGGAEGDPASVGPLVARYMNDIINLYNQNRGGSQVRLISPVFNATNPKEPALIDAMNAAGANWGGLEGIALNAYNLNYGSITDFLNAIKAKNINNGKPYILTEVGMYEIDQGVERNAAKARMKAELDKLKADPEVAVVQFFASFATTNPDPRFAYNHLTDEEFANLLTYECVEQQRAC